MSDTTDPTIDPNLAKDGDEGNEIEMPIQLVGEHVKSGRKILADYDSATGALTVRPKWLHLADMIQAEVEESEAWKSKHGQSLEPSPVDPDKAMQEIDRQEEALAKEEERLKEDEPETPAIPGVDLAKLDPNVAAILMAQQQQMQMMMQKLTQAEERRNEAEEASREKGVVAEGRREMHLHRQRLRDDIEFAEQNEGVPMPPKKNPRFGDKTPAYVSWLKEYRPDVYEERYGVTERDRSVRLIDKMGQSTTVLADVARRKVTTTQKIEQDPSLAPDMDWNA